MQVKSFRFAFNASLWNPSIEEWMSACRYIQVEERRKIAQYCYKDDAKVRIAGRLLLRYALTCCIDIQWKDLRLLRDERDKPYLDPSLNNNTSSHVYFNASHQGDFVVVGTDTCNIGVDVMDIRESHGDLTSFFKLMNRQFTSEEWISIKLAGDPQQQMKMFYRHWCLKESFVKALGVGISYPLLSLNFKPQSPLVHSNLISNTLLYNSGNLERSWCFEESMIDENHVVAVACNESPHVLTSPFEIIDINRITKDAEPLVGNFEIDSLFEQSFHKPIKAKSK